MKMIYFYHFDSDPRFPQFYYMLSGNLGSLVYGDVSVMHPILYSKTGVYIFFLIFALKHRLWILVRTATLRRF